MIVIFWLFIPFFIGTIFVLILDFVADAVMSAIDVGGDSPL